MDPLLYIQEEFYNVERALTESLRYDYGPGQTVEYYEECRFRLAGIQEELGRLRREKRGYSAVITQLWDLANRLTLIERSHLGEFSWPFADVIRRVAASLLAEDEGLAGKIEPIIHMIAEGTSYQILSENILSINKKRRIFTVAFPRQLKQHVLMHALFGHELGHATFYSARPGGDLFTGGDEPPSKQIIRILRREGPLRDCASAMTWLVSTGAPTEVCQRVTRAGFPITEGNLNHWLVELVCDLFGLVIFGPSFVAAHRTYLEPSCKSPFEIDIEKTSHPAYALRRNLLIAASRTQGWLTPVVTASKSVIFRAEEALIEYISGDDFGPWASVFTETQISEALKIIRDQFAITGTKTASRPDQFTLVALVERIAKHLPPIREEFSDAGVSSTFEVRVEEQLYAGWTYWLGRDQFRDEKLSFFQLNQLCDLALLQQQAIDLVANRRSL